MKIYIKKITFMVTAFLTAFIVALPAQAAETEHRDTVIISGFECWIENGLYFTEADGEKCQVINMDDYIQYKEITPTDEISTYAANAIRYDVDLSNGNTYEGKINITNGDDSTPVFFRKATSGLCNFEISTQFFFTTSYSVTIHYENFDNTGYSLGGSSENETFTFYFPIQTKRFFVGSATGVDCTCQITFHRAGSNEQERNFTYWIKAIM